MRVPTERGEKGVAEAGVSKGAGASKGRAWGRGAALGSTLGSNGK